MHLKRRSLIGVVALAALSSAAPPTAHGGDLHLSIALEDSVFLEGQSVYAFLCARNTTRRTVMEPDLRIEEFRAKLVRTDTGQVLRTDYSNDDIYGVVQGLALKQGAVRCYYALDLARFGVQAGDSVNLSGRQYETSLRPGPYALTWEYRFRPRRDDKLLKGEARFTVRPLASDPRELSLVHDFLSEREREPLRQLARRKLPEFYGSRYLLRVYLYTGPLIDELNFDEIFEGLVRAGGPPERRAALLALRLSLTDMRGQFTPRWRQEMQRKVESRVERDALSIVPRTPVAKKQSE